MDSIGRYKIECELGRGAMGIALRAVDSAIGRTVAIKTIRLGELTDPDERKRLRDRLFHEARSAGMVSHPGIVTIYDVAEEGDLAYIAMEYVNGPTLDQLLSGDRAAGAGDSVPNPPRDGGRPGLRPQEGRSSTATSSPPTS